MTIQLGTDWDALKARTTLLSQLRDMDVWSHGVTIGIDGDKYALTWEFSYTEKTDRERAKSLIAAYIAQTKPFLSKPDFVLGEAGRFLAQFKIEKK